MPDKEQKERTALHNEMIVEALRETFHPIVERLTSDVEPATIYLPYAPGPDVGGSSEEAE